MDEMDNETSSDDSSNDDNNNNQELNEILDFISDFMDDQLSDETLAQDDDNETIIDLINYDINLPLEHSYLGGLRTPQGGRKIFADGSKLRLSLVYLSGIILVPGQEIPFTFRNEVLVEFFQRILNSETQTFGIGYSHNYGTTAEIRSYSFTDNTITIKTEGRQRFRIVNKNCEMHDIYNATVVILPEIELKDYFKPICRVEKMLSSSAAKVSKYSITPFYQFVYKQYDNCVLMEKLKDIFEQIIEPNVKNSNFNYPVDANGFSYFVLTTIPFPDEIKAKLLQMDCCTRRLRVEYGLLTIPFDVRCANCTTKLCDKKDFLVMSKRGTGGTFVNPSGFVHELFTFSKVSNVIQVSRLSDEFSWFPNYGWIIIKCRRCLLHLGWKFKTIQENIKPKSFWAITRNSISLSFDTIEPESFVHDFVNQINE